MYTKEDVTRALANIKHLHINEWYSTKRAVAQFIPTIEPSDFPTLYAATSVLLVPTKVETTTQISEQEWYAVLSTVIRFGSRLNLMVEGNMFFYNAVKSIMSYHVKSDGFLPQITREPQNATNVFLVLHAIDTLISIKPIQVELDEFVLYTSTFNPFTFTLHEQSLIVPLLIRVVGFLLYSHVKVKPILSNEIMCYMVTSLLTINNRMRDETVQLVELLFGNQTFVMGTDYSALCDMLNALKSFVTVNPTCDTVVPRVLYALHHLKFANYYPMIVDVYVILYGLCMNYFMSCNWGYNSDQWMDTCYACSRIIRACVTIGIAMPPTIDLCNFMIHWADRIACGHCNYDIEEDLPLVPLHETQVIHAQSVFNSTLVTKTPTKGLVSYISRLFENETLLSTPRLEDLLNAINNAAENTSIIKYWVKIVNRVLLEKIEWAQPTQDVLDCLHVLQSVANLVNREERARLVSFLYYFDPSTWREMLTDTVINYLPMHEMYARLLFSAVDKSIEEQYTIVPHLLSNYINRMRQYQLPMDIMLLTRRITILLKTL
jgi:hypothetical protein